MDPVFQSAAMGALPQLHAATAATAQGGEHYGPDGLGVARTPDPLPGRPGSTRSQATGTVVATQ